MIVEDIENGLEAVLGNGGTGYNIAFPNKDHGGEKPHIKVQFSGRTQIGNALKGGQIDRVNGVLQLTVISDVGIQSRPSNTMAQTIANLYGAGDIIPITGGNIVISRKPDIRDGYRDGSDWRVPVIIRYTATSVI